MQLMAILRRHSLSSVLSDYSPSPNGGCCRAGLTIRGPHTNVRRGPFLVREARIFLSVAVHFFPKKVDDLFLVVVTLLKRTLNVQTSKQCGTNLAADRRGALAAGVPSHGTTGTIDNPALGGCKNIYWNSDERAISLLRFCCSLCYDVILMSSLTEMECMCASKRLPVATPEGSCACARSDH